MKRLHTSVDTLNKHERLLFVTHNVKVRLIVVFDSFTASPIVLAETLFLSYRQRVYLCRMFSYSKQPYSNSDIMS